MASEVIGTWYPSGYHGHYRSRTRTDVLNEYRQKAKPVPPEIFHRRLKDIRLRNPFTSHDNKSALILDASGFGQGVGKKKVDTRCSSKYQPEFFAWVPERHLPDTHQLMSVNQVSYTGGSPIPRRKVLLSASKETKEQEDVPNSTYRVTYGSCKTTPSTRFGVTPSATPQVAVSFSAAPPDLPPMTANQLGGNRTSKVATVQARSRTKSAPVRSLSVQDCMIWHDMRKKERTEAPPVTVVSPPPQAEQWTSNFGTGGGNEVEIETVSPLNL